MIEFYFEETMGFRLSNTKDSSIHPQHNGKFFQSDQTAMSRRISLFSLSFFDISEVLKHSFCKSSNFTFIWKWLSCISLHFHFPDKSANYFIATELSNPLLSLPFKTDANVPISVQGIHGIYICFYYIVQEPCHTIEKQILIQTQKFKIQK